jgi:protein involved in polysaccharide export with SLBB domain
MDLKSSSALRGLGSLVLAAVAIGMPSQDRPPLRLKPGDTVTVTTPYGGDLTVQPDGAVYGRGYRVVLEGRTLLEAQGLLRNAMREFVPPHDVFVTVRDLKSDVVYVVGLGGGRGPVPLAPDMTLRQLLASSDLGPDADRVEVQLFRNGQKSVGGRASEVLLGRLDQRLAPNDVVALSPAPFVRVWVLGQVLQPGETKLPLGTDVYRAIASAGGFRSNGAEWDTTQADDVRVTVRRGPQVFDFPLRPTGGPEFVLEPGDTVSVMAMEATRVTVLGEVASPGEFVLRGSQGALAAIAAAGGPNEEGTLAAVSVLRKGELYRIDATDPGRREFELRSGDLVYVGRNERAFTVLGQVQKPGKYLFKDGERLRVTDALAAAGGLASKGTFRRVCLARAGADGKVTVTEFHLDDFLKFGKQEANPEVLPGDTLLFGQPKGVTLSGAMQVISGGILLDSLIRSE